MAVYNQDGTFDEAASRAANAPVVSAVPVNMPLAWTGTVGGKTVTIGDNHQISDDEALANLRQQSAGMDARAATDPEYWRALHPEASDADFKAYSKANRAYKDSLSSGGIISKIKKAASFEVDRATNLLKNVAHNPRRLITGVDPASTKLWNKAAGFNDKPLVDQLGGATEDDFNRYEAANGPMSLGAARSLSKTADMIAGTFGAVGAAHGLSQAAGSLTGGSSSAPTGDDLGIFSNGGKGGIGDLGMSNAQRLAASGAIKGGAGVGIGSTITGGAKYARLADDAMKVVDAIKSARGGSSAAPDESSDVSSNPSGFSFNGNYGPLRRFERTPETLFTDMRNGGNPMKVTKISGVAAPTRVTAVKSPAPAGRVSSAPKTPPAVNAARSLADVRRKSPRAPARAVSY